VDTFAALPGRRVAEPGVTLERVRHDVVSQDVGEGSGRVRLRRGLSRRQRQVDLVIDLSVILGVDGVVEQATRQELTAQASDRLAGLPGGDLVAGAVAGVVVVAGVPARARSTALRTVAYTSCTLVPSQRSAGKP
jgi:hypothetical protein